MFKNRMAVLSVAVVAALAGLACNTPATKQEEALLSISIMVT